MHWTWNPQLVVLTVYLLVLLIFASVLAFTPDGDWKLVVVLGMAGAGVLGWCWLYFQGRKPPPDPPDRSNSRGDARPPLRIVG